MQEMRLNQEMEKRIRKYRWVVFSAISLAMFFVQFHRNSSGVIRNELTDTFNMSATSFGTFSAMYFYTYMLMQLPIGIMADKIGVRKTVTFGCILSAIGTIVFATANSFIVLCIGRAIIGAGVSAPMICMNKLIPAWFRPQKVATMLGLGNTIGILGGVLSQVPLSIAVGLLSWRYTFAALGIASAVVAAICFFTIKDSPKDMGSNLITPLEVKTDNRKAIDKKEQEPLGNILRKVFSNKLTWPMFIIMPAHMAAYTLFSATWGVPYIQDVFGYSSIKSASYTTYLMIGSCIGTFGIPALSDKMQSRKIPLAIIGVLTFSLWVLLTFGSPIVIATNTLGIIMFLMGFTTSGMPILFSLVREVNDPAYVGISIGIANTFGTSACAILPIICGNIMDYSSNLGMTGISFYKGAFTLVTVTTFIGLVAILFVRETHCKNIYSEK